MSSLRLKRTALLLAVGCALLVQAGSASAQKKDARASAEFIARSSVQTIYQNLLKAGYEWEYIRDEKMPDILVRSVDAIEQQTSEFDRSLILGTYIPTYISSFYEEVDKLNAKHEVRCMTVNFIEITFVPFVEACSRKFSGKFSVRDIVVPVLAARYSYKVCEPASCLTKVSSRFNSSFEDARFSESDFTNLCATGS